MPVAHRHGRDRQIGTCLEVKPCVPRVVKIATYGYASLELFDKSRSIDRLHTCGKISLLQNPKPTRLVIIYTNNHCSKTSRAILQSSL